MKKAAIFVIMTMILTGTLAGCQTTPDSPIVIGKNLESIADSAVDKNGNTDLSQPENLKVNFEGVKQNVKFYVNADVVVPQEKNIPVARVVKKSITDEDVKNFYDILCSGTSVKVDEYPSSYYLELINQNGQDVQGDDGKKLSGEESSDYVSELQAKAAAVPDDYIPAAADFSFKSVEFLEMAKVWTHGDDGTLSQLLFKKVDGNDTGNYVRDILLSETLNKTPNTSMEKAKKLAGETVTKLGFADFECNCERISSLSSIEMFSLDEGSIQNRSLYEFMFTRTINGVPITYTDNNGLTVEHEAVSRPWMYEKIRVFVDDNGIFAVMWSAPYELSEIVTERSTVKKFDEIKAVLQRMLPIIYEYKDSDPQYSYEIKISKIKLGLMRVTEKNVGDKGLVIPVWDVFGTETLVAKNDPSLPLNNTADETGLYTPLITINAIDGSIIDRELGY